MSNLSLILSLALVGVVCLLGGYITGFRVGFYACVEAIDEEMNRRMDAK